MADLAEGEHRVGRLRHRGAVLVLHRPTAGNAADTGSFQVGSRVDRHHPRRRPGRIQAYAQQSGVWVRAAQDPGMRLSGSPKVVRVAAPPRKEPGIFLAAHAGADALEGSHHVHRSSSRWRPAVRRRRAIPPRAAAPRACRA